MHLILAMGFLFYKYMVTALSIFTKKRGQNETIRIIFVEFKMQKKQIVIFIIVVVMISVVILGDDLSLSDEQENPIIAAFQESGANCMEVRLVAWKKIEEISLDTTQLEEKVNQMAEVLLLEDIILNSNVAAGWSQVIADGNKDNIAYQVLVQSPDDATYMIIRAIAKDNVNYFTELSSELLDVLGEGSEYNALITGQIDGKLSQAELKNLFSKILLACGGKLVNVAYEDNYYSVGAFINQLDNKILVDNKTVNLQLAANYQEKDDKTYLYFGLPLVFSDY